MYKQTETQIPVLCHDGDGGRHYKSHFKLERGGGGGGGGGGGINVQTD